MTKNVDDCMITIYLAKAWDRNAISDLAAAAIIAWSVSPNDTSKVVHHSKGRREKSKTRQ